MSDADGAQGGALSDDDGGPCGRGESVSVGRADAAHDGDGEAGARRAHGLVLSVVQYGVSRSVAHRRIFARVRWIRARAAERKRRAACRLRLLISAERPHGGGEGGTSVSASNGRR